LEELRVLLVGSVDEGVEKLLEPWIGFAAADPCANLRTESPGTNLQSWAIVAARIS